MSTADQQNITCKLVEQETFEVEISEQDVITIDFKVVDYIPHRKSFYSLTDTDFDNLQNNQVAAYDSSTETWKNQDIEDVVLNAVFIFNEIPTRLSATLFRTLYNYQNTTLQVFLNGIKIKDSYITKTSNNTFTLSDITEITDDIEINYIRNV